ncbi:hypothetical protein JVT61DRAFT_13568 [Boletus reticuloceps]|uniref:Transmembrane protein n=1 Tax=Boletus reticuloceps TaxID=495285 RepID=A0A8I2YD93_9AGAM|nr:hypothetical protein JVT61DRAFT_13568 [Boletus reticuloceps]
MRQRETRAVGQIAFAAAVWTLCLPVVSACDSPGCEDYNGFPPRIRTVIIAVGGQSLLRFPKKSSEIITVGLVLFFVICVTYLRRRRLRQRTSQLPYNRAGNQASHLRKPSGVPVPSGYSVYYQAAPSYPAAHIPQYPPRGYDSNSQLQWASSSNAHRKPEPVVPVSPVFPLAPSGVTSRPISSLDTAPPSLRSSVRQDQSTTRVTRTPDASSLASPRSTQRDIVAAPLSPQHTSSSSRSRLVASPPAASAATLPSNTPRPFALSPTHTGATNNRSDDPPPAYTPI